MVLSTNSTSLRKLREGARGGGGGGGGTSRVSEACFHGESCSVFVSQWDVDVQGV